MPTSLVSTGVQFPDSTVQTTAASASGLTLLQTVTGTSASTIDITGFSNTYKNYRILGINIRNASGSFSTDLRATADLGSGYTALSSRAILGTSASTVTTTQTTSYMLISYDSLTLYASTGSGLVMDITGRTDPSMNLIWTTSISNGVSTQALNIGCAQATSGTTIVGLRFYIGNGGNTITGTFKLYGYKD